MATTVTIHKVKSKTLQEEIKEFVTVLSEKQTFAASEEIVKEVKEQIKNSIQRPGSTGNLASGFFAEKILNGYGIGNIDNLNKTVPYWHWINFGIAQSGRRIPPGSIEFPSIIGTFAPGIARPDSSSFRQGRFQIGQRQSAGGGIYPLQPKRPIEPHNFIERTEARIQDIINQVLETVK